MMPQFSVANGVYVCRTEDGAVFLDSNTGDYSGLGYSEAESLVALVGGWPALQGQHAVETEQVDGLAVAETLMRAGLLTTSESAEHSSNARVESPSAELEFEQRVGDRPRVTILHLLAFVKALLIVWWYLHRRPLKATLRRLSLRASNAQSADSRHVKQLTNTFLHLQSLLVTRDGACLFDSLCLMEFLASFRVVPTIIIGVRTSPFEAHCWVQDESIVLNDTVAKVQEFRPILAI
jgi:hypothetical protein